jgi:hypothetical protein
MSIQLRNQVEVEEILVVIDRATEEILTMNNNQRATMMVFPVPNIPGPVVTHRRQKVSHFD